MADFNLDEDERVELTVQPKTGLMLRFNDLFRIPLTLFMLGGLGIYTFGSDPFIPFVIGFVLISIFTIQFYYQRYSRTVKTKYLITNKRIVWIQRDSTVVSKYFESNLEVSYVRWYADRGYVIVGDSASVTDYRGRMSFEEEEFILDNLTNYEEVSSLLRRLTKKTTHNPTTHTPPPPKNH